MSVPIRDGEWGKYAFSTDILLLTEQKKGAKHEYSIIQLFNYSIYI